MKTIEEIKEEMAIDHGWKSYDVLSENYRNGVISHFSFQDFFDDVVKVFSKQQVELAVDEEFDNLRLEMVKNSPKFNYQERTGTKKHSEWIGFGNAITVLDNFKLSLRPQILEKLKQK